MPDSILIRSPRQELEWETVKDLLRDYRNEFDDNTCFTTFEDELKNAQAYYSQPGYACLVAVRTDNTIMGCVALRPIFPDTAEMKRLYVQPAFRSLGLGRLLAEAILQRADDLNYHAMILDTLAEMKAAQHLYHQLGFMVIPPYQDQDLTRVVCFGKKW